MIVCGIPGTGTERIYMEDSDYFGLTVDVYTAMADPEQRTLYRASALAHKFHCATNQVGMYLVRRRHQQYVTGLYQATSFQSKPPGRTGLKAGGYFVSKQVCHEFEQYMRQHSKHTRHRGKTSTRRVKEMAAAQRAEARMNLAKQKSQLLADAIKPDETDAIDALLQGAGASVGSPVSSRAVVVSPAKSSAKAAPASDQVPPSSASLLHDFATVSMQSATMHSGGSPPRAVVADALQKKRKSMSDATSAEGSSGTMRRTPESPNRQLAHATEHLTILTDASTAGSVVVPSVRPVVELFDRDVATVRACTPDDDQPYSYTSGSHASSVASSATNSQVTTPINAHMRMKTALTQLRPKQAAAFLFTTTPTITLTPGPAHPSPNGAKPTPTPNSPTHNSLHASSHGEHHRVGVSPKSASRGSIVAAGVISCVDDCPPPKRQQLDGKSFSPSPSFSSGSSDVTPPPLIDIGNIIPVPVPVPVVPSR